MNRSSAALLAVLGSFGVSAVACAQSNVRMPSEFETPGSELGRLFSYFGGVASYATSIDPVTIHTGNSCRVDINFRHDTFFRRAGVGVGTLGIVAPVLAVPAGADTFSVTIESPMPMPAGAISVFVTVREDDNADGIIDAMSDDDQWESAPFFLTAGTNVYNIPAAAFIDSNGGTGNDVRNFTTTTRLAWFLTIETATTYPGGIIETPVSMRMDHAGFYVGAQSIPEPACLADFNNDHAVNSQDFFDFTTALFAQDASADVNHDTFINSQDFFDFVAALFAGC